MRFAKTVTVACLVLGVAAIGPAVGQRDAPRELVESLDHVERLLARAGVPADTLKADRELILDAYPALLGASYKSAYPAADAPALATSTWLALRRPADPDPAPDETKALAVKDFSGEVKLKRLDAFVRTARSLGKLTVVSDPDEARVLVNGFEWQHPTKTKMFLEDDRPHIIVVIKEGYEEHRGTARVRKGENRDYTATLKRK
jgi:hypothetical protein